MDDEIDEEKEEIDKKKREKIAALKEKMIPIDSSITDVFHPEIPQAEERMNTYSNCRVEMFNFQKDFIDSIQKFLGFNTKSTFMRYAIISFCLQQKAIFDIQQKTNEEFGRAYKKWRKKYITEKYKIKERVAELKKMAPAQDEGNDDPFTAEDLMD